MTTKDRIEAAIRHIQTAADVDPWAMELAVDALKAQGTCEDAVSRQTLQKELALYPIDDVTSEDEAGYNRAINDVQKMVLHLPPVQTDVPNTNVGTNGDTIYRQDAIDAILAVTGNSSVRELYEHVQEHGLSEMWSGGVSAAIDVIIAVPSAQPKSEERTAESTQNVPNDELISRKAAIDAVDKLSDEPIGYLEAAIDALVDLPSALPDNRLSKIANLVEGTIDHFDLDDAMDLLYQIKEVLK